MLTRSKHFKPVLCKEKKITNEVVAVMTEPSTL